MKKRVPHDPCLGITLDTFTLCALPCPALLSHKHTHTHTHTHTLILLTSWTWDFSQCPGSILYFLIMAMGSDKLVAQAGLVVLIEIPLFSRYVIRPG